MWKRFKNPDYIAWRNSILQRDQYICQKCHKQCKKYEKGLAAHHIKEYAKYPELRLDINNGITLCRECHMEHHGRKLKSKTPIACGCGCGTMIAPFDVYGRPRKYVNYHKTKNKSLKTIEKESQNFIKCRCGCGQLKKPFDPQGRPSFYIKGHGSKGRVFSEEHKNNLSLSKMGKKLTEEHKKKLSITRKGKKKSPFTEQHCKNISLARIKLFSKSSLSKT